MFDEKTKSKIIRTIKKELKDLFDYNPDFSKEFNQRTDKYNAVLPEVFWNIYGEPNFTNREMRKLDLSCISFENEIVSGYDFSYTNVDLDPTKVRDKCIDYTNLEGVDLHNYTLDEVSAIDANLTNSGVMVDFDTINCYSRRTKLEGCFVLESSIAGKVIPHKFLDGVNIVDSFEKAKEKVLIK